MNEVGKTYGVEEEFHVVDPDSFALVDDVALNTAALENALGRRVTAEIATTQVETNTDICTTMAELWAELVRGRGQAARAARRYGAAILAASTHPFGSWRDQRLTPAPRYTKMLERFGAGLTLQQVVCGCHVHIVIPDLDTGIAVMDRARPYLPVLLAMTGSSPFHEGVDTGYDSYRTEWLSRWPTAGPNEPLGDARGYYAVVESLRKADVIEDASFLYWDIRPSARYSTIEFRVADVCTELDDAVLHATLVRSLCRVLAARSLADLPPPSLRPEVLRAARWRAARFGLAADLVDPHSGEVVAAKTAVGDLLAELRDDLEDHGEWDEVSRLTECLLSRGTSAQRQRSWLCDGMQPEEIAGRLVEQTSRHL